MNLIAKDLNLLNLFEVLSRELNTTKTAKILHLSQPAVSHGLARLRVQLGDELFVRSGKGLVPTPRARELQGPVTKALEALRLLYQPESFHIKNYAVPFRIATTDFFEYIFLPAAFNHISSQAPNVVLNMRPTGGELQKRELENGELDLAVAGFYSALPEGFHEEIIRIEPYQCIARKMHPALTNQTLTLEKFTNLRHVLVSPQGDLLGAVDKELKKLKKKRLVVAGVSSFQSPAIIVAQTDLISTVPKIMALKFAQNYALDVFEPPLKIPPIRLRQVWHQRTHNSPAHRWLRQLIRDCAGQ